MKKLVLKIQNWVVCYHCDNQEMRDYVAHRMSNYIAPNSTLPPRKDSNRVDIYVEENISEKQIQQRFCTSKYGHFWLDQTTVCCVNLTRREATIAFEKPSTLGLWDVFLVGFAASIKRDEQALSHAALISKRGRGIYMLGRSGAGKSSLSLDAILNGFKFYGDEHPILYATKNRVRGKSFISPISLYDSHIENYPELKIPTQWNAIKGKHDVNPLALKKGCVGTTCPIDIVLFPKCSNTRSVRLNQLNSEDIFSRLLLEDICCVADFQSKTSMKWWMWHQTLLKQLSETAKGFTFEYAPRHLAGISKHFSQLIDE